MICTLRVRDMSLTRRKAMAFHAHKVRISRRAMRGYITLAEQAYHARRSCAISRRCCRPYHSIINICGDVICRLRDVRRWRSTRTKCAYHAEQREAISRLQSKHITRDEVALYHERHRRSISLRVSGQERISLCQKPHTSSR